MSIFDLGESVAFIGSGVSFPLHHNGAGTFHPPHPMEGRLLLFRRRLFQAAAAATLSATVAVTGTPAPAQAVDPGTVVQVITAVQKAYELWRSTKTSSDDLAKATAKILGAIADAKTAIITHVDELAAADARACTTQAVIEAADADLFPPATLTAWAQEVTRCVTLIDSLLGAVTDRPTLNTLGFVLNAVGPIALAARARAGLSTAGVATLLVTANNKVVAKSAPNCWFTTTKVGPSWALIVWRDEWGCAASDGTKRAYSADRGKTAPPPTPDLEPIKIEVGATTSWRLAQDVGPLLQA